MSEQILKTRDDRTLVRFEANAAVENGEEPFKLADGSDCTWLKNGENFGITKLRSRIEPWLTALFQSEHLSLLAGSGLSHAVHYAATGEAMPGMARVTFADFNDQINAASIKSAERADRETGNIEDQIRVANELLRGLEIIGESIEPLRGMVIVLKNGLKKILEDLATSTLVGEKALANADEKKRIQAYNYLVSFLMSFASRTGTRDRLQIFTTNYDRYIEAGSELAGLRLLDRFIGTLAPLFRSSRLEIDMHYNPPGIRGEPRFLEGVARFTKLHGSLDWIDTLGTIQRFGLPFGADSIEPYLKAPGLRGAEALQLMIYPNSSKDRETASYPYVELFRDFASAICRPNSTLVCYGYSFGDEHINRVIEDMLTIPSTHVVIIAYGDPLNRIVKTYERLGRHPQITLLLGDHLGDLITVVDNYLPKPAIDRTTFKMADLLNSRWGTAQTERQPESNAPINEGEVNGE